MDAALGPARRGATTRPWRLPAAASALTVALLAALAPAGTVGATPAAQSIQQQIDQSSNALEKIIEQYNGTNVELQSNRAAEAKLETSLIPLQQSMAKAQDRVADFAAAAYEGSTMSGAVAMLDAGTPQDLIYRLNALGQIGHDEQRELAGYEQAKARYDAQQRQLSAAIASDTSRLNGLAAQRTTINNNLAKLYTLRAKAYGSPTEQAGTSTSAKAPYVPGRAGIAVQFAYAQLGKPYVWAAAGPRSYDCSGLTMAAWRAAGVVLPHNAAMQWRSMPHIRRTDLRPGDLVFYLNLAHVAMYVGNNQIIQAPRAGENVKLSSIDMLPPYGYGRPSGG